MNDAEKYKLVADALGFLFEDELIKEMAAYGKVKQVKANEILMNIGDDIVNIPVLIEGAIKVLRENENGDELILYYIEKGDTCAVTMSCCSARKKSEIRAVAEVDTTILMIPVNLMENWLQYKSWRRYVFQSYHERLREMGDAIDNLAFNNLEQRLFNYLKDKVWVNKDPVLEVSHQEMAFELNTSRVVISRLMKKLEKENKLEIKRGKVKMLTY